MFPLSTFTCANCNCTNKGHFSAQIDKKLEEKEKKREEENEQKRIELEENAFKINTKTFKKFKEECSKHNSEWNGWKGKLFPWKVETSFTRSDFTLNSSLEIYQIIGFKGIMKETPKLFSPNKRFSQKNRRFKYIECPVCTHKHYFE